MSVSRIKLLELLSARMFHDLAGPIGAIHNSIEFFEEDTNPNIKERAIEIVKSSANDAVNRLKFFRQAYGNVNDKSLYSNDIVPVIEAFISGKKFKLVWENKANESISSYLAKAIMNFTIIASNSLIQGGILAIHLNEQDIRISFQDANLILSEEVKSLLEGKLDHIILTSTNIQVYYTYMILQEAGAKLTIKHSAKEVEFVIN